MDKKVVTQKIDNLIIYLNRIDSKHPTTALELKNNYDLQDIISINRERAIQSCIDISAHLLTDYDDLGGMSSATLFNELANKKIITPSLATKLSKAAGIRNLLVHRYTTIDWDKVHNSLQKELSIFRDFIREIGKFCGL